MQRVNVVVGPLHPERGWRIIYVSFTCGLHVMCCVKNPFLISQPISFFVTSICFSANNVCKKGSYTAHNKQIDSSSDESESEESEVDAGQTRSGRAVKRPRKVDYGYQEESNKKTRVEEYNVTKGSRKMLDDLFSFEPFRRGL